jgi:hypothetical protein
MDLDCDLELILLDLEYEEKENRRYLKYTNYMDRGNIVRYVPIDYNIINYFILCMNINLYLIYYYYCMINVTK